ncbi:DUF4422 domain-containing protein [Frederiksenia canicola]|uniref:Exopolysaccharide biosynthesis protein n=1 Tax=Frederiksenia canicola TaxID=123824 RepID=A0AAE7C1A1_9PAST|nr:DUF4422 domain-containing protein [Frederiksenia canicola]QIM64080.1 exopolysaccharide biosynthesis protein [Frederiksenia canicola]RPE93610.1 uncharacterized protein DUF4422 [Frederiksenia canicola]
MKNIKVIIATHKKYFMPEDSIYLPVHVGKLGKESIGYQGDDTGDNISKKNPFFCELTGLYWAWKNLDADYIGLIHYRRFFSLKGFCARRNLPIEKLYLDRMEIEQLLDEYDVIVPKRRNYYIETLYSHYANTLHAEHLDVTRDIISELYSDYLDSFDSVMRQRGGHMFNMFIMSKTLTEKYCEWLFDILFELEKRIPAEKYSAFHARFYGRVSELLFNVWLKQYTQSSNNGIKIKEIPFFYGEKINWFKKGSAFLLAKFWRKKYEKSF